MCGGGGGGGGGAVHNNRPVATPPIFTVERPPSVSAPENRPTVQLNNEDTFAPARNSVRKVAKPKPNIISRAVDAVKEAIPKVSDAVRNIGTRVGREIAPTPAPEVEAPAPVAPPTPRPVVPR